MALALPLHFAVKSVPWTSVASRSMAKRHLRFALVCFVATASCARGMPRRGAEPTGVAPGVEVLLTDSLHLLRCKCIGIITNHSGRVRQVTITSDMLFG